MRDCYCFKGNNTWRPRTLLLSLSLIEAFSPTLSPADDAFNFSEFIICWSLGPGTPNCDGPLKIKWNKVLQEQCKCCEKTLLAKEKSSFFEHLTYCILKIIFWDVLEKQFYNKCYIALQKSVLFLIGCYRNLYLRIRNVVNVSGWISKAVYYDQWHLNNLHQSFEL